MLRGSKETDGLATEAYLILRERILRGELSIGQVISRRKLATELGMSLLPVSEAMLRLEHEGLLESRPRAGTRIRVPTPQDVRGHYIVREALEVQAAKLFAEIATQEERAELMKLAARVDALSAQADGNRSHYLNLHEKLHRRIAECARCEALTDAIEKTHALSSTWRCASRNLASAPPSRRHQELIAALSQGDPAVAGEAMREHIQAALGNALLRLKPYFQMSKQLGETYARSAKRRIKLESSDVPTGSPESIPA
jgi:GntR family transcriptional regulator, rspAB operon transcriptional repressor